MCCTDELYTAFGDGAGGERFEFTPDLVDDDHFGVVILHGFDHHLMLKHWLTDLHAACLAHSGMRHIAIAADLIRCINDDHALVLSKDTSGFTQKRSLAHTRATKDQHRLT